MANSKGSLPLGLALSPSLQPGALRLIRTALRNSAEEPCKIPMRPSCFFFQQAAFEKDSRIETRDSLRS
jgi:hypothetical protein